jgi:hypothetical protein
MYTLQGKPDTHDMYASYAGPCTSHVCFLQIVPIHGNLSRSPYKVEQALTPGRSLGNQRQTGLAVVLGHLILPPLQQPWSRGEKFAKVVTQLHPLTGPISPSCDQYVQYLLTGANSSVLNRHWRGLQPWRCRLSPHHTARPSQPTVSAFHLRAPLGLRLFIQQKFQLNQGGNKP